jgi:hypothetical protein
MNSLRNFQRGATPIMTLIWILILVSLGTLCIKIIPIYIDDYAVASSLEGLKREPRLPEFADKDILASLDKFFTMNSVRGFNRDAIEIIREDDTKVKVQINYEVRTNIVSNIDAVVSFSHAAEVKM